MTATLQPPDVSSLQLDGLEVVRLVGVRVRTPEWGTVASQVDRCEVERGGRRTQARFEVAHAEGAIAFRWTGSVSLDESSLTYEMDGVAERAFDYARIGIVILHPPAVTAGRPFVARRQGKSATRAELPRLVGPQLRIDDEVQPLFPAFDELEIELTPGLGLRVELEGDLFEMEDQRNWTDASFKTYSTPVGLPLPHHLSTGDRIRQRARFELRRQGATPAVRRRFRPRTAITLCVQPREERIPALGTSLPGRDATLSADARTALTRLRPAHLRLDLASDDDPQSRLADAFAVAAEAGAELELVLRLGAEEAAAGRRMAEVRAALGTLGGSPVRTALAREGEPATTAATANLARTHLPDLILLGGSPTNFAELNRDPPSPETPIDGLYFAANPQVHDSDDRLIMLSPSAQRDAALTARSLPGKRPVHVSPITLRPQGAADPDPRHRSLFAAAWLVASAAALTAAGASSVTWFSVVGSEGIIDLVSGHPYGSYHVLRELFAWSGQPAATITPSDPEAVAAVALEGKDNNEPRILLANLTATDTSVDLSGLNSNLSAMALTPEGFCPVTHPELGPYGVVLLATSDAR